MSSIELQSVYKTYNENIHVLRDVNLEVKQGEFCVFVGPSGCGKSTLLRSIAGLDVITSGNLLIDNKRMNEVPPAQRGVAMVFQSYALFPHLSVYENMAFGMQLAGVKNNIIQQKINEAARVLQLEALLDRKPKALSGGQRQRVAIGRAIVRYSSYSCAAVVVVYAVDLSAWASVPQENHLTNCRLEAPLNQRRKTNSLTF